MAKTIVEPVLMRHPCVYEDLLQKFDLNEPDVEFKPWNLLEEPSYTPSYLRLDSLMTQLQKGLRWKRLNTDTQEADMGLMRKFLNEVEADEESVAGETILHLKEGLDEVE